MKIKWFKLPFGFFVEDNKLRRTAWAIKIIVGGCGFRFVEWHWSGFSIQWYWRHNLHAINRQYIKGRPHLKKWYKS